MILLLILLIISFVIILLRNNLTLEETVSRFMYLIENKEYEKAKKYSNRKLENLDLISNIDLSKLTFTFSDDKKNANATISEEEIQVNLLHVTLNNSILGWKINNLEISKDNIDPQIIEDRLKNKENVSDIQKVYWAQSSASTKDEISEYIADNTMVAAIFINLMQNKDYDKANELYNISDGNNMLTFEQLKEYDWEKCIIKYNFKLIDNLNGITLNIGNDTLYVYVTNGYISSILKSK